MGSPENKDEAPQDAEDPPKVVGVNIDEKQNTLGRYAMDDDSDETDDELQPPDDYGGVALGAHQKRAKREKRLAMNRASARERRRRKRILLNKLEEKVLELTKKIQTLQDVNDGLQVHVRKLEGDVAKSHTVIASLSSGATRGRPSPATSSLQSMDPGLRSLLLGGRPSSFPTELGAGATGGFSGILAERQILLDLQAHQRHRNMLQANAGIAGPGALGAGRPIPGAGPTHPLFGRMNYLNALTENTVSAHRPPYAKTICSLQQGKLTTYLSSPGSWLPATREAYGGKGSRRLMQQWLFLEEVEV